MDIESKVSQWDRRHSGSEVKRDLSADKAGNFARCFIVMLWSLSQACLVYGSSLERLRHSMKTGNIRENSYV